MAKLPYDINGFALAFKRDSVGAVKEIITKYIASRILRVLYGMHYCEFWITLFRNLLRKEKFLLIILDDARYDVFKNIYSRYLQGTLIKARVPPPNTYGWLPEVFSYPEFDRVRVFYASIGIESHDIRIKNLVPGDKTVDIIPIKPNKAKFIKTVLPSEVNEAVMKIGLTGRDIIWYAQPHFPWIIDRELSLMLMRDVLIHDYVPPDTVKRRLRTNNIPRLRVINAYYANLMLALKYVKELIDYSLKQGIKYEEIVVTSDHGEMLGELGLYLHQEYDLPQLTTVPWLKVHRLARDK
jgi:hypothetical protein